MLKLIDEHRNGQHRSLGIICKTVAQARQLHEVLSAAGTELTCLDYDSTSFASGAIITSAHIAKGLEFDTVIVPQVDEMNYTTEIDRCMLYIACTRAMHELHLIHDGPLSPFLEFTMQARSV